MKVKAPWWITHAENEDEEFFIAFAWDLAQREGMDCAYYLHVGDMKVFFKDHTHTYIGNVRELRTVQKWFHFGKVAKNMWRFNFLKTDYEEVEWEIKNPKLIAIWLYLEAKRQAGMIMHNEHLGLQQRWRKNILPDEMKDWLLDR